MKTNFRTMLALAAGTIAAVACTRIADDIQVSGQIMEMTFSAEMEPVTNQNAGDTKATVDGKSVLWTDLDSISVFARYPDGDNHSTPLNGKFILASGAGTTSGQFNGMTETSTYGYLAVYPYSKDTYAIDGGDNIYLTGWNGKTQEAVDGGVDKSKMLLGGFADAAEGTTPIRFGTIYNLCSYVRFTLQSACKKIEFKANGNQSIAAADLRIQDLKFGVGSGFNIGAYVSPSSTVTLVPQAGQSYIPAGTYMIAVLPCTLSSGFTIVEYPLFSQSFEKKTEKSIELKRSNILNLGKIDESGVIDDSVDLGLKSGTIWATHNVGANKPEELGNYYEWGYTTPLTDGWPTYGNYHWAVAKSDLDHSPDPQLFDDWTYQNVTLSEVTEDGYGDAASVLMGSTWHMPTYSEAAELLDGCTMDYITYNGKEGFLLTSKTNGNAMFMPVSALHMGGHGDWWRESGGYYISYYWINNCCTANYMCSSAIALGHGESDNKGWIEDWGREFGIVIRACKPAE